MKPIEKAIKACGSQEKLAQALGLTQSTVSQWITGRRPIPAHQCRKIETATGGMVTCFDLRPDVFAPAIKTNRA